MFRKELLRTYSKILRKKAKSQFMIGLINHPKLACA